MLRKDRAVMPVLKNWHVEKISDEGDYCLHGVIFKDTRFPDRTAVVTSRVKRIDFDKKRAETSNRIYELGGEYMPGYVGKKR